MDYFLHVVLFISTPILGGTLGALITIFVCERIKRHVLRKRSFPQNPSDFESVQAILIQQSFIFSSAIDNINFDDLPAATLLEFQKLISDVIHKCYRLRFNIKGGLDDSNSAR